MGHTINLMHIARTYRIQDTSIIVELALKSDPKSLNLGKELTVELLRNYTERMNKKAQRVLENVKKGNTSEIDNTIDYLYRANLYAVETYDFNAQSVERAYATWTQNVDLNETEENFAMQVMAILFSNEYLFNIVVDKRLFIKNADIMGYTPIHLVNGITQGLVDDVLAEAKQARETSIEYPLKDIFIAWYRACLEFEKLPHIRSNDTTKRLICNYLHDIDNKTATQCNIPYEIIDNMRRDKGQRKKKIDTLKKQYPHLPNLPE